MSMMSGLAEDAKLRRMQDATKAYAMAWQTGPQWPAAIAGGFLLLGAGLALSEAFHTSRLVLIYTPLAWALAQHLAFRAWAPPLGLVQLAAGDGVPFPDGPFPRTSRFLLTAALAALNLTAPLQPVDGVHVALASLATLAVIWAGPARVGDGMLILIGTSFGFGPMFGPSPHVEPRELWVQAFMGVLLLLYAPMAAFARRRVARVLARATAEMGTAEKSEGAP